MLAAVGAECRRIQVNACLLDSTRPQFLRWLPFLTPRPPRPPLPTHTHIHIAPIPHPQQVFAGYLLFRDPPPMAQRAIVGVARLSHVFQRAILYAFPAVCWSYGAGFVFSSFVSVVFWTG